MKDRTIRKEAERQRKEDEILDAALKLFARKGYEGTTIEDIAEELGYGKASLYYYFAGKDEIVKELIYGALESASHRMDDILGESSDPVQNLGQLIGYYVDDAVASRGFFKIHHQVAHFMDAILSPEERAAMGVRMAEMAEKIGGIFRRGVEDEVFLDLDPKLLAEMTLGMISGLMHQMSQTGHEGWNPLALKETIVGILVRGIRRQEAP